MPTSVDTGVTVLPSGLAISSGLNIGERDSVSPVDPNASGSVNWIRTSDGAVIAEIDAYIPDAGAAPRQHYARWNLTNQDGVDAPLAQMWMEVDSPAPGAKYQTRVVAAAKYKGSGFVYSPTIVDANGGSSFVQAVPQFGTPQVTELYAGSQVVSMPGIGAGGTGTQVVNDASFGGRTPLLVIAQFTTGGTIYFSNQYIHGTHAFAANQFQFIFTSGNAFGAGWTIGVMYIAMFLRN